MAMADDGELIIIAPGVHKFGEDDANGYLIAKYGVDPKIMEFVEKNEDLQKELGVAAHLIHGSSEGRFKIFYAPGHLTKEQIESVGFEYLPLAETMEELQFDTLKDGFNTVNGERSSMSAIRP